MKDLFGQLYNGFMLRDLLGYVVPGGIVLACFGHFFSLIKGIPFLEFIELIPDNGLIIFFIICFSYGCGHFLSGFFFHTPLFKRLFKYSPNLSETYPDLQKNTAWARHRSDYRRACKLIGESLQSQIERHAALVHFTGHISASLLFCLIYMIFLAIYSLSLKPLLYAIPIVIIFPGIFSHFRQLAVERFDLERIAIESLSSNEK